MMRRQIQRHPVGNRRWYRCCAVFVNQRQRVSQKSGSLCPLSAPVQRRPHAKSGGSIPLRTAILENFHLSCQTPGQRFQARPRYA